METRDKDSTHAPGVVLPLDARRANLLFEMGEMSGYARAITDVLRALDGNYAATDKVCDLMAGANKFVREIASPTLPSELHSEIC